MEPRYLLDKDSICYGCQNFKAVEDCKNEPYPDDEQCGGACDCVEPCFAGSQNEDLMEVQDGEVNKEFRRSLFFDCRKQNSIQPKSQKE